MRNDIPIAGHPELEIHFFFQILSCEILMTKFYRIVQFVNENEI